MDTCRKYYSEQIILGSTLWRNKCKHGVATTTSIKAPFTFTETYSHVTLNASAINSKFTVPLCFLFQQ